MYTFSTMLIIPLGTIKGRVYDTGAEAATVAKLQKLYSNRKSAMRV